MISSNRCTALEFATVEFTAGEGDDIVTGTGSSAGHSVRLGLAPNSNSWFELWNRRTRECAVAVRMLRVFLNQRGVDPGGYGYLRRLVRLEHPGTMSRALRNSHRSSD